MFEAGALAKSVKTAKIVPLCIDLPFSDVTGPLAALQKRSLGKDDVKRLLHDYEPSHRETDGEGSAGQDLREIVAGP
jgi:hypothetical protein